MRLCSIFLTNYRHSQQKLKSDHKKAMDAKKIYESRCNEEILSNQCYHQEVAKRGKASREADKVNCMKFAQPT